MLIVAATGLLSVPGVDLSSTPAVAVSMPAAAWAGVTARVSVSSVGVEGNSSSDSSSISDDGRYVSFTSFASNLVPGDANGLDDVFLHDRREGTTSRVSVSSTGGELDGPSFGAAISADGRFVAFTTGSADAVPGDRNGVSDVFVRDLRAGLTTRVNLSSTGVEANAAAGRSPMISSDGRYVVFDSWASNLTPHDTNESGDVFVRDRLTGTTTRVSRSTDRTQADNTSGGGSISTDGRRVAFLSHATNLVPSDTNDTVDVFVHDRRTRITSRISQSTEGTEANGESDGPSISANGRHVAFNSFASNLVSDDTNDRLDAFVHDLQAGTTTRVSQATDGTEPNGGSAASGISGSGRYVAFASSASNLDAGDGTQSPMFIRDRRAGTTTRIGLSTTGIEANASSFGLRISGNGRHITFQSFASNLVPADANDQLDVFVRSRKA